MDGEDVFGRRIRVDFFGVDAGGGGGAAPVSGASLPGTTASTTGKQAPSAGRGSHGDGVEHIPAGSSDSGVRLSSSDDGEEGAVTAGAGGSPQDRCAPADDRSRSQPPDSAAGIPPGDDEDIVVCGPVEEMDVVDDVVVETPTRDQSAKHDGPPPSDPALLTTPSKTAKKKPRKSRCASKPCKPRWRYSYCPRP